MIGFLKVIATVVGCGKSRPAAIAILVLAISCSTAADAQDTFKIGLLVPMTGRQASTGREINAAIRLYMARHGDMVAGNRIEIIVKDDGAIPDVTRRIAQELIVGERVNALLGFGTTPSVYAVAPLLTQARIPGLVMAAGASDVTTKSPYILRTGFTMAQSSTVIAAWAVANGIQTAVTIVSDYSPGHDAQGSFKERFLAGGGRLLDEVKVPVGTLDFAPALQRVREASPDAVFIFVPSGQVMFMNQFAERGLDKAGIKVIGPGDITDDDQLPTMRDSVIGTITAHMYSASHPSGMNLDYVSDFERSNDFRPNFMSVAGYDGMHLIYEALKKTGGSADGDALVAAMKGMTWESPRGVISIDADTRDIVQNIYVRRVERVKGSLYNSEFATFEAVKDPGKVER
jgi:branched-chain amino acid transport system substrate-binding protein